MRSRSYMVEERCVVFGSDKINGYTVHDIEGRRKAGLLVDVAAIIML